MIVTKGAKLVTGQQRATGKAVLNVLVEGRIRSGFECVLEVPQKARNRGSEI